MVQGREQAQDAVRAIAFYLPQFHPIPENEEWWGKGFTEWVNVRKAKPLFPGHYQPHVPGELGYYQLPDVEIQEAQAELARQHGIFGFCYYHYWFNGKQLLDKPLQTVIETGRPNFPFCICWANENWTRRWDGGDDEILIGQSYSAEDDAAHIASLIPVFQDPRYIKVNGKPLFLVYRLELLPDAKESAAIWRAAAKAAGFEDLYLAGVESCSWSGDSRDYGFDASIEFAPDWTNLGPSVVGKKLRMILNWLGTPKTSNFYSYKSMVDRMLSKPDPGYPRFRGICPGWDNTSRRKNGGAIVVCGSTPELYQHWLSELVKQTRKSFSADERMIFINGWNEWAEGCHLEPDRFFGRRFLLATKNALGSGESSR